VGCQDPNRAQYGVASGKGTMLSDAPISIPRAGEGGKVCACQKVGWEIVVADDGLSMIAGQSDDKLALGKCYLSISQTSAET
jgi:hypothetical protein